MCTYGFHENKSALVLLLAWLWEGGQVIIWTNDDTHTHFLPKDPFHICSTLVEAISSLVGGIPNSLQLQERSVLGQASPILRSAALRIAMGCLSTSPDVHARTGLLVTAQRTHDAIITLLLCQNDVAASFWRNNDVIIASCVRLVCVFSASIDRGHLLTPCRVCKT